MNVPWKAEIAGPGFEMEIGPVYRVLDDGATYSAETDVHIDGVSFVMEKDVCRFAVRIALSCHSWKEVVSVAVTSLRSELPSYTHDQSSLDAEYELWRRNSLAASDEC
jgi:hypothetical protein